jgi:glycosyltransferase involved in cell wall biosynthesis
VRLGILTQYYPPETGAPQARLSHLAEAFARQGHEVVVLTAMPNYPRGKVFEGYGGLVRKERRNGGVSVIRTWIYPTQSVERVRRLFNYFSFVGSSALVGSLTLPKLDYLMTESPPLFLGIAGYWLARRTGARWIFNVSDLWPESAVRLGVLGPGTALRAAERLEAFCYRKAWLVTGQSSEILADVEARFPGTSTYLLSNGVDTDMFGPQRRTAASRRHLGAAETASNGTCIAVYAGLHGIAQGLDQVLDAAAELRNESIHFVLVGEGPEKTRLVARASELRLPKVRFLDSLSREDMPALMASADIAIVPLKLRLPGAVPSKLYEAMGSAAPVVLVADGESAAIVKETGAGFVVAPGDVAGLAKALKSLASDTVLRRKMGIAGRAAAEQRFSRQSIAERFIARLEERPAC